MYQIENDEILNIYGLDREVVIYKTNSFKLK